MSDGIEFRVLAAEGVYDK